MPLLPLLHRSSRLSPPRASDSPFMREVLSIREDLLLLKACLAAMRVRLELKYSDTQPRWPAGDPRGGQWRPKEGGEGEASEGDGQGFSEAPDGTPIELAGDRRRATWPVDLVDEEGDRGGHSIERHVRKTDDALIRAFSDQVDAGWSKKMREIMRN